MLHLWATVTTVANTTLGVVGIGVAAYAATAKPSFGVFYYGVALVCVACAVVGFVNLYFLNQAVRRYEEKVRPIREERERKKAERAAKKAEKEAARAEKEAAKAAARAEQEAAAQAAEESAGELPLPPFPEEAEAAPEGACDPVPAEAEGTESAKTEAP